MVGGDEERKEGRKKERVELGDRNGMSKQAGVKNGMQLALA